MSLPARAGGSPLRFIFNNREIPMKKQIAEAMIIAASLTTATAMAEMPQVPEKLRPAAGETLALETRASGVQIYECGAGKDGFQWVFKGPEADLFDRAGNRVGRHYGGPTWESSDGSKVVAALKARDDAPDANAIPWLLLGAKSATGDGVFGRTKSIQRVSTAGGLAPAEPCTPGDAGKVARVAYTAVYYFYQ